MSKRKHAALWRELVDEAGEDEVERAANVSVGQAETELTAAHFDGAAERAKASAFLETLENGSGDEGMKSHPDRQAPSASSRKTP